MDVRFAGGRLALANATLRDMITLAYPRLDGRLRNDSEVAGGPAWTKADRFDIVAKADLGVGIDANNTAGGAATSAELSSVNRVRAMIRALLAERFRLTVHEELRDLEIYALLIDRKDATLGPQLKAVDVDCVEFRARAASGPTPTRNGPGCGGFRAIAPGHMSGHAVTMSMFAGFLEGSVSRTVVDRTGLRGLFDLDLEWAADPPSRLSVEAPQADLTGVSIFTAIREQLGLKLEARKGPVNVLVVDQAEKPTAE